MKPKKLSSVISSIPNALKSQPKNMEDQNFTICDLNSL